MYLDDAEFKQSFGMDKENFCARRIPVKRLDHCIDLHAATVALPCGDSVLRLCDALSCFAVGILSLADGLKNWKQRDLKRKVGLF